MHAIRIDRSKRLAEEPHSGHNRYHPDISPALEVGEGEEVVLETRDALDGQLKADAMRLLKVVMTSDSAGYVPNGRIKRPFRTSTGAKLPVAV